MGKPGLQNNGPPNSFFMLPHRTVRKSEHQISSELKNKKGWHVNKAIVTTKGELAEAQKSRVKEIFIKGNLADQMARSRKIARMGGASLAVIAAATAGGVALAPATGGLSLGFTAGAAAMTGTGVATVVAVSSIGLSLVIAVLKDYKVIEVKTGFMSLSLKA